MADIRPQLSGVWNALAASSARPGGRVVLFIATEEAEGTSTVARAFAELAAGRAHKPVWLCDLDLVKSGQHAFYDAETRTGDLGPAFDMTLGATPFWQTVPADNTASLMVSHQVGASRLHVSRFRTEFLRPGQAVQVAPAPDYWQAVRKVMEVAVVDAPPLSRSRAGLALAADMDGVVLVVAADATEAPRTLALRDEVIGRGGRCLGVVVNRVQLLPGQKRAS